MLMDQYMKQTASDYLHWVLQDSVKRILESQESCEVGGAAEEWVGLQRSCFLVLTIVIYVDCYFGALTVVSCGMHRLTPVKHR